MSRTNDMSGRDAHSASRRAGYPSAAAFVCAISLAVLFCTRSVPAVETADIFVGRGLAPADSERWNHGASLVRTPDGVLICTWVSGSLEGQTDNRVLVARSDGGGGTWSAPAVAVDPPGDSLARDPQVWWLADRLWLTYVAQDTTGSGSSAKRSSVMVRTSADTGGTWSAPVRLETGRDRTYAFGRPTVLPTGEWLLPFYWRYFRPDVQGHASVLITGDSLRTWRVFADLVLPDAGSAFEPSVVALTDGTLLMHLRTSVGTLYRSVSADGGRTWSAPEPTDVPNSDRPGLARWSDGTLLAAMPDALDRDFLSVWASTDGGRTWPRRLVLGRRTDGQVSYGCPVTWGDSLAVVWSAIEYPDGPTNPAAGTIRFARAHRDELTPALTEPDAGWQMRRIEAGAGRVLRHVVFPSPTMGWIAGDHLWRTTNGGATWDTVAIGHASVMNVATCGERFICVAAWSRPQVRSTDDGRTWRTCGNVGSNNVYAASFTTPASGWVATKQGSGATGGHVYATADSGRTWTRQTQSGLPSALVDVAAHPAGTVIAVGTFAGIARSTDAGQKWQFSTIPGQTFAGVDLVDDCVGWLAGNGALFRTLDGGATWQEIPTPLDFPWQDVVAADSLAAWAVGRDAIIATADGGRTWHVHRLGAGHFLQSIAVTPDRLHAVGYGGEIWTYEQPVAILSAPAEAREYVAAWPNPVNGAANVAWHFARAGAGEVAVYDAAGQVVWRWELSPAAAMAGRTTWDGCDGHGRAVGSGTYLVLVRVGREVRAGRLTVVR